jgi:hypothetical protein
MEQSVDVARALLQLVHLGNAARIVGGFCSHESPISLRMQRRAGGRS